MGVAPDIFFASASNAASVPFKYMHIQGFNPCINIHRTSYSYPDCMVTAYSPKAELQEYFLCFEMLQ